MNDLVLINQSDLSAIIESAIEKKFKELISSEFKKSHVPEWITSEKAVEISGLSKVTLWRERKNPKTVLKTNVVRGQIYYEYDSIIELLKNKGA